MKTNMAINITIFGDIESAALYEDLKDYQLNVIDIISKTYVYGVIDLTDPSLEQIIQICAKYGEYEVKLRASSY